MKPDTADMARLAELRPRRTPFQWAVRFVLIIVALGIVRWAWIESEIQPRKLLEQRKNAWTYLFGRQLDPDEQARVYREAQRLFRIQFVEEARLDLLAEARSTGVEPPPDIQARAVAIAESKLGSLSEQERQVRVDALADQLVSEKGGGFFPPELRWAKLKEYLLGLSETVAIAIWGSIFAVILAVPVSVLGADKSLNILAPGERRSSRGFRWLTRTAVRRVFDACRGFNEFVMALIFVAVIGLGPFAGVLALAVHTFGVLGKVFSEAIETCQNGPIEGVGSTGAGSVQTISMAVMPQIMPFVVSQSLLRFESNVRSATILGICGAGGIGQLLNAKIGSYQYQEVCTMMLMIIITVSLIDFACGRIMKRYL